MTKLSEDEPHGGEAQEGERFAIEVFEIFGEPAASTKPGESPFDDPTLGQDHKSPRVIAALDDFNAYARQRFLQCALKFWALIAAISIEFQKERIKAKQARHQQRAAIAILNAGAMHDSLHQQTLRVEKNIRFLPLIS